MCTIISDIAFFISYWFFFMVSMSFFMLLYILITITLNYLINSLPSFHLVLLENFLVISFGICFSFWLLLFIFCLRCLTNQLLNQSVVNPIKVWSAVWFKHQRVGQSNSCWWSYCFPSGWCHLERSILPEKDGFFSMGLTQRRGPGSCSFHSLPSATSPRLSSNISSPLCPPSARAQG